MLPPVRRYVTVASEDSTTPFLVRAARRLGADPGGGWFLVPGQGDLLARGAFILFPRGTTRPAWALKFSRVPGPDERIDRDARALRLAAGAAAAAARAPRFIGRLTCGGYDASLETAAPGRRMDSVLSAVHSVRVKRRLIGAVVDWVAEVARETAADPALLEPERGRLRTERLVRWIGHGAPEDLVDRLPPLRPVLQHNDLGTWNLVVDGDDFTALDWESARPHGFPVWDVLYFLADALANLDGAWGIAARRNHFRRLFLGELPSSSFLRSSVLRVARATDVPLEAIGDLTTLCWLDHALSHASRRASSLLLQPGAPDPGRMIEERAILWLETDGLGPDWAWSRRTE
jgi:hypothetical protein